MNTPSGVRCEVVNQIVEETKLPITYKQLRANWFPKKTKHQRKEEQKEREETEGI